MTRLGEETEIVVAADVTAGICRDDNSLHQVSQAGADGIMKRNGIYGWVSVRRAFDGVNKIRDQGSTGNNLDVTRTVLGSRLVHVDECCQETQAAASTLLGS
jgi:hypothetical protein